MTKKDIAREYNICVITLNKWLKQIDNLGKPLGRHYTGKQLDLIQKKFGPFKSK